MTTSRFLDPATLASLGDLRLLARTVVEGFTAGLHLDVRSGVGVEFSQYRSYQPGDDLRRVDWRVYGRSDRFFVRESDVERDDSYYIWRLNMSAGLEGTDIDRSYDTPVHATPTQSQRLSSLIVERAREKQQAVSDRDVLEVVQLKNDAGGRRMVYPFARNVGSSLGGFIVGAVFAAVGWYLIAEEGHTVFGSVFGGIGALVGIFALYMMINSLEVSRDAQGIRTVRRILGIPVKRSYMHSSAFVKFTKDSKFQSQSGGKHVMHYSIYAVDIEGDKVVVGEGFKGESEAKAAMRLIGRELGLQQKGARHETQDPASSWDPAGLLSRSQ